MILLDKRENENLWRPLPGTMRGWVQEETREFREKVLFFFKGNCEDLCKGSGENGFLGMIFGI